jgi:pimeloyl-ACP methyl ester carboxylesterase
MAKRNALDRLDYDCKSREKSTTVIFFEVAMRRADFLLGLGASVALAFPARAQAQAVDEADFVQIGGIRQWVTIRGSDRANPVLLIVGGTQVDGPGAILSPYVRTFKPFEQDFTLVQWDPRGAGKTFVANGATLGPDLTIDQLVQDGLELVAYLRGHLGKRRIVLLGVNFGSTLAVKMIQAKPELFSAYVAAGQITRPRAERERYGYERLLRLATAAKDEASLADLKLAGTDVWREPRDPARVAAFQRVFVKYRPPVPANPMREAMSAPHWTIDELMAAQGAAQQNERAIGRAWGETFDYASLEKRLLVPVFVFQGEEATSSPASMAKAWLDGLRAPKKVFVTIPGAGNHALETHTAIYLELLDRHVRPVAAER